MTFLRPRQGADGVRDEYAVIRPQCLQCCPSGVKLLTMLPAKLKALRHRVSRLALSMAIAAIVLVLILCCGLRIYAAHMANRAFTLLDEASRIAVGSTEDSVLPLVARYGGVKRIDEPSIQIDNCSNGADCDYQNAHKPDFSYEFEMSPYHIFELKDQLKGLHRIVALLMVRTSSLWRGPLSMRLWLIVSVRPSPSSDEVRCA